jgi:hypothetical protein
MKHEKAVDLKLTHNISIFSLQSSILLYSERRGKKKFLKISGFFAIVKFLTLRCLSQTIK